MSDGQTTDTTSTSLRTGVEDVSHIDPLRPFFNQLKAEERAFASTGADFADFFPGSFAGKVRIPERPCAALDRARGIDGTLATF